MLIKSECVWVGGMFIPAVLDVRDRRILAVLPYHETEVDDDWGRKRIVPGFIDIHTHGAYGFDTNSAEEEGLKNWKKRLPSEGVTSFLATTATAKKEVLLNAVRNVARVKMLEPPGADILGVHLEGPYIDKKYHGAQPVEAIAKPDVKEFMEYQSAAGGLIKVVTVATEYDEDWKLTRYCSQHGVVVSIGHSAATLEQAALAVANGARSVTHTYNGMSGFTHRANGLVGAAMRLDSLYCEIICDCNHSTPEALNLLFRTKGKEKPVMISDSVMCKGFQPGEIFHFAGLDVEIYPDGSAHLIKEKNLAGSTMKMNEGLKNLVERALVPFDAALNACTVNPATLLKLDDQIGRLAAGCDADLVVLDHDYSVLETYCKGRRQHLDLERKGDSA